MDAVCSRQLLTIFLISTSLSLAACSSNLSASSAAVSAEPTKDIRAGRALASEGLARLKKGQFEAASRIFNAGLKFEPDNPTLHFLNGLTYHITALRGDANAWKLAATGYQMTLKWDPGNFLAAMQIARLHLDKREYRQAEKAFRHALEIDSTAGEAYLGLASSAYYERDLDTAANAVTKAYLILPDRSDAAQAAAIIFAATGNLAQSDEAMSNFDKLEQNGAAKELLRNRVAQWRAWRDTNNISRLPAAPQSAPTMLVRSANPSIPLTPDMTTSGQAESPDVASTSDFDATQTASPENTQPMQLRWTDCDTAPIEAQNLSVSNLGGSYGGNGNTADTTTYLPPLPVPCKNRALPRMAVFDVNIIRTEDLASSSYGINLLSTLNIFFDYQKTTSATGSTSTLIKGIGLNQDNSFLSYAMNIANASDSRSEVLARPTLVALDRQPSNFFSGRNVTLGIAGQSGGASSVEDRAVGISLSVTPTFVSDESMLVSVKADRSFMEQVDTSIINFTNSLQTSRNSVTANVMMKFGETLILSGLTEHEIQRTSGGVPVLRDIPAVQYLFSNKSTQNFTSSVIVMITPRKPVKNSEDAARAIAERESGGTSYAISGMTEDYIDLNNKVKPTMDSAIWHTRTNSMYYQFRNGDLKTSNWNEAGRLDMLLSDIGQMIYF